jgi:hypothetical protein
MSSEWELLQRGAGVPPAWVARDGGYSLLQLHARRVALEGRLAVNHGSEQLRNELDGLVAAAASLACVVRTQAACADAVAEQLQCSPSRAVRAVRHLDIVQAHRAGASTYDLAFGTIKLAQLPSSAWAACPCKDTLHAVPPRAQLRLTL